MLARVQSLLFAVLVLSVPSLAAAQMSPFGLSGFTIDQADIDLIAKVAAPIYADPPPANGTSYEWNNAQSGNSGTITLLESGSYKDLPCRKIHYTFKIKNVATDFSFTQERCRVESGEWKSL